MQTYLHFIACINSEKSQKLFVDELDKLLGFLTFDL